MPSLSASTAMAISARINDMIHEQFPPEQQADALRLVRLSSAGGDNLWQIMIFGGIVMFVFGIIGLYVAWRSLCWGDCAFSAILFAMAALFFGGSYWIHNKRDTARVEYNTLVQSNPAYWKPINDKLKKIVLEAGQFPEGQRTTISH